MSSPTTTATTVLTSSGIMNEWLTTALPILTAYALEAHGPRPLRRLYDRRAALMNALRDAYAQRCRSAP